ncbi:MAG: tetratricopeptide repeat protein, partial [Ignavibacteria bacterium]
MRSNRFFTTGFLLVSSLLVLITNINASPISSRIDEANTYYREGSYEKAIEIYESLVDEGYLGVSLFYNLGNTYYRVGKIGYSILYYEKALKLDPSDDDIKHNLEFAYLSTVDRIQPLPRFILFDWWEGMLGLFSANGWAYLVFFSYLSMLTCIGAYFFSRT